MQTLTAQGLRAICDSVTDEKVFPCARARAHKKYLFICHKCHSVTNLIKTLIYKENFCDGICDRYQKEWFICHNLGKHLNHQNKTEAMMITETRKEEIITRLTIWGYAVAGGVGSYARIGCLLGAQAGSNEPSSYIPINPEVELTERAVCKLQEPLRAVVIEHYTVLDATAAQHFAAMGMSKSAYYRALEQSVVALADIIDQLSRTGKTRINNNKYEIRQKQLKTVEMLGISRQTEPSC